MVGGVVPPDALRFTATVSVAFTPPRVTVTGYEPVCAVVGTPEEAKPTEIVLPETLVVSHDGIPDGRESVTVPVAVPPTLTLADEPVPLLAEIVVEVGETLTVGVGVVPAAVTTKVTLNERLAEAFAAETVTVAVYVPTASEPEGLTSKLREPEEAFMLLKVMLGRVHASEDSPVSRRRKLPAFVPDRVTVISPVSLSPTRETVRVRAA